MGNNGSSHQHCPSNGLPHEMGRGWTQSFPRELTRHHSQPAGHKVLPEPPNQRLRATNNGSIIHNGGTISGRRPSALTLPHDLNKQGVFRSRSTSASNVGMSRSRKSEHHCCHYPSECMENEMQELKRFGSEPDLRYSPSDRHQHQANTEQRHCNGCYAERESRERESRYKGKKKYKAPAPPANGHADGSSPDSYKWEMSQERESRCRPDDDQQPNPPRRSRLFKTRAETKRAQVNWVSNPSNQERNEAERENERRWRHERGSKENGRQPPSSSFNWRSHEDHQDHQDHQRDRWRRDDQQQQQQQRRSKLLDGKNTLQRSMSSPEFQAELMQVARKVRNKLNCGKRSTGVSENVAPSFSSSLDRKVEEKRKINEDDVRKKQEKRTSRSQEVVSFEGRRHLTRSVHEERRTFIERTNRIETTKTTSYEEHRSECSRDSSRTKEYAEDRQEVNGSGKRRASDRSASLDDDSNHAGRKPFKERLETLGHTLEERFSSEKLRRNLSEDVRRTKEETRSRKCEEVFTRTRSESPVRRSSRDKLDVRGQGSGRESTPEPAEHRGREKENSDPRWRKNDGRSGESKSNEKRWPDTGVQADRKEPKPKEKLSRKPEVKEAHDKNWHILPPQEKTAPKTFYFGMDEALAKESRNSVEQQMDQIQSRLHNREINKSPDCTTDEIDDGKHGMEDISLKLRPTLPKKQLEIPRFSPSAAWRLLSALEAPGPTMSTASEEIPVMFEERIERLSRPPPPLVALGPRSSHDKSGDSGISGDAGGANDDSLDVSTTNRMKTPATRPTWTPQQDLGEESSSDAGVDSPPPMPTPVKFPPRAHVFSLSLPRDDSRMYIYNPELKGKESSAFNSLQKLKRSVSGALGLAPLDLERKRTSDVLDDNWLLSSSAPTSLQHNQISEVVRTSPAFDDEEDDEDEDDDASDDRHDFPIIMKPPSFSYLASGGHVMYLPEASAPDTYQAQRNVAENERTSSSSMPKYKKNGSEEGRKMSNGKAYTSVASEISKMSKRPKDHLGVFRERSFALESSSKNRDNLSSLSKSCENISEMKQRSSSPGLGERQNLQDPKDTSSEMKTPPKTNSKSRRFTFQSTVRQIERRRLAEKLSREAEAKERQRKGELEAMRKVEEEFQRKRAREKASIRQQLRLYSMDENLSLPTVWDSSQVSRADPDGAPSSSASSPTSAPPGKLTTTRKSSVSSDEYHRKRASSSDSRQQPLQQQQQQQQREYKDYRPKYFDWAPDTSSHLDYKQTTVHPKVVCDIPKSSPVFVDANVHGGKTANPSSTPRSDNYRKDFAHGAVAAKSSLASSDSELSQPNTRPHSRQTGNKVKPLRSRSASPERSEEAASSEDESPVEPIKQERNPINGFILNGVQPFVREKSYRPISFNPQPPPAPIPT